MGRAKRSNARRHLVQTKKAVSPPGAIGRNAEAPLTNRWRNFWFWDGVALTYEGRL